jgi:hypothetical protein
MACRRYPGGTPRQSPQPGTKLLKRVFPEPYNGLPAGPPPVPRGTRRSGPLARRPGHVTAPPKLSQNSSVMVIDPSALPSKAGVQLVAGPGAHAVGLPQVVYASRQCTGS